MAKHLISGPILVRLFQIWARKSFLWVLIPLDARHCCKLWLCAISRKTNVPNSRKWLKTSFWVWLRHFGHRFELPIFFSKIMVNYHHVQYQKKTNRPILRKLSGGRTYGRKDRKTDRRTDRQADESDFIGCCPTNVEYPKITKHNNYTNIKNSVKATLKLKHRKQGKNWKTTKTSFPKE